MQQVTFALLEHSHRRNAKESVAACRGWIAQLIEEMDEVAHYLKTGNLGFQIPNTISGKEKNHITRASAVRFRGRYS